LALPINFPNRTKGTEISSCKDAVDICCSPNIEGSCTRRFQKAKPKNCKFKALAYSGAVGSSMKISQWLRARTSPKKLALQSGMA
jgi:hypothetical protein